MLYNKSKLTQLLEKKKNEKEELLHEINSYKKQIYAVSSSEEIEDDSIFTDLRKAEEKLKMVNLIITEGSLQIRNVENLEKRISDLEEFHTDLFKSAYRLLNTKI